jgi:hypothetical protein
MTIRFAYGALFLLATTPALAAPSGTGAPAGSVQGVVVAPAKLDAPPSKLLGFVPPIENPIVELRPYDPLPEIIIYLEPAGGSPAEGSAPPKTPVVWQLQGHSFSPPVLPVVTGSNVDITNVGRETHLLYSPGNDALIAKDPIGPDSTKSIQVSGKDTSIQILSRSSPHLEGRLVPLPTHYFARVERSGKFHVDNVPPGKWTLRVWFRDGWITLAGKQIDVPSKGDVRIELTTDELSGKKE